MTDAPESEKTGQDFDQLEIGDTAELTDTFEWSVWNQIDNEFLGTDKDIDDMHIADARIGGSEGNETVVVEVAADVTKVDPDEKPVFQTEERFKHGYNHSQRPWWKKYVNGTIATLIAGGVTVGVGSTILNKLSSSMVSGPQVDIYHSVASLIPVLFVLMVLSVLAVYIGPMPRRLVK
jgi:hypothetical protein